MIERVVDARLDEHMQKYKLHGKTIALWIIWSKLIERVVDARLDEHMQKYKLHGKTIALWIICSTLINWLKE